MNVLKLKIYLSEAWICSEFGYQRPAPNAQWESVQPNLDQPNIDARSEVSA